MAYGGEPIYDDYGLDKEGFDRDGFDEEGFDKFGFDKEGNDHDGFSYEWGYDKHVDPKGYGFEENIHDSSFPGSDVEYRKNVEIEKLKKEIERMKKEKIEQLLEINLIHFEQKSEAGGEEKIITLKYKIKRLEDYIKKKKKL